VAAAFAHTFWWAVVTILLAFIPTLFLPNHAARAAATPSTAGAEGPADDDIEGGGVPVAGARLD
jgi:hypothetical protein